MLNILDQRLASKIIVFKNHLANRLYSTSLEVLAPCASHKCRKQSCKTTYFVVHVNVLVALVNVVALTIPCYIESFHVCISHMDRGGC
jgi:hypothetical protein